MSEVAFLDLRTLEWKTVDGRRILTEADVRNAGVTQPPAAEQLVEADDSSAEDIVLSGLAAKKTSGL